MAVADRGVLYVVWGDDAQNIVRRSVQSLHQVYPDMPVHVVVADGVNLPQGLQAKTHMGRLTPFRTTLFLDADTVVLGSLEHAFQQAERHGLACAICECPWARRYGPQEGDHIEYNTGVLFFTQAAKPVFDQWEALAPSTPSTSRWLATDGSPRGLPFDDQAAFAQAVHVTQWNPYVLPLNYNFRPDFHRMAFAPLKVWHDRRDPPQKLLEISRRCEANQQAVSLLQLNIS